MQFSIGAQTQEDTAAREQPKEWHKNNKALIKAENLKGLLEYLTYEIFRHTSAIIKIRDGKIC